MATCGECGADFAPTEKQRENLRAGRTVYCTKPCLYLSRSRHSRARWESGQMPKERSEKQRAAAKRLGEYSRANKITGPAHPQWKGGEWTNEAKAARRARWEQEKARRAGVPDRPCMVCGITFKLNSAQRGLWYKHGDAKRYCCSLCRGNEQIVRVPPFYYAPAVCAECDTVFNPQENQRVHRYKHPDAELFCSPECVHTIRVRRLAQYREINGVMKGPTHPSWKTGWHSKQAQEARHLVHHIKKFINEGANQ